MAMIRSAWLLLVLFAAWAGIGRVMPGESPVITISGPVKPRNEPVGSVGCSAAACHGKPDQKALTQPPGTDCWKASATIYHAIDLHRKAYDALTSPLGGEIARKLATGIPASEDTRCLACHANPSLAWPTATAEQIAMRSEGVSCEGCHGNASRWKAEHTAWNEKTSDDEKRSRGFNTLLYANRAAVCAGCHVGAPAGDGPVRDMNHDMIAAGHPRLDDKSFAELKANQPQHFLAKPGGKDDGNAFADALRALNQDRAERAQRKDSSTPWPEFAGMDCKSCHRIIMPK